jgi:rhodanese-related sulfurtransferase
MTRRLLSRRTALAADIDALLVKGDVVVLDVREPKELEETGTVTGARHTPLGQLEARLGERVFPNPAATS